MMAPMTSHYAPAIDLTQVGADVVALIAQLRPHMLTLSWPWRLVAGYLAADVTYVLTMSRHGHSPAANAQHPQALAYMAGAACVNWSGWNLAALLGLWLATRIPSAWGLGFAGTLALLALLVTLLKDWRQWVATIVAAAVALACTHLPFRLNIVVAIACAIAVGLGLEALERLRRGPGATSPAPRPQTTAVEREPAHAQSLAAATHQSEGSAK